MALHIPGYRVIRKINQGGMSTVYLAIQISVGRVVALKVMNPQLNSDPAFSERFQREATIVGQLSHPNIVAIYDIGRHEDLNYIAMDYLPNGSIHDRMASGVSGDDVLRVMREIASALDHSHEKGYIHRDIKPENILFRTDNSAVLSDFGVARGLTGNLRTTHVGTIVGTPHYMSPEQTKGAPVDGRSDLYSLGIVFYEMLTGSLPYQGEEAVTIALKHISAPIPKLPLQYVAYQKILEKLLAKDPDQRFQRGRELIQALDEQESIVRTTIISGAHPDDLSVITLARALADATLTAMCRRWDKVRALRWSRARGFYVRESNNVTEIFSNEGQAPTNVQRTEIVTRIDQAAVDKKRAYKKLTAMSVLLILAITGTMLWLMQNTSSPTTHGEQNTQLIASTTSSERATPISSETPRSTSASEISSTKAPTIGNTNPTEAETASLTTTSAPLGNELLPMPEHSNLTATEAQITPSEATLAPIDMSDPLTFTLSEATSSAPLVTYALQVKPVPTQARVRILNIPERYQPGIQLPSGAYHIEVTHPGYEAERHWIEITDANVSLHYTLNKTVKPGDTINNELVAAISSKAPEMVRIPTGSFLMGNNDDPLAKPVQKVIIRKNFALSKYEITFADYDIFAQATNRPLPDDNRWGRGTRPVINVSFEDARAYARWLSETTGKKYRLPTEAEWEYVARANTTSLFWWGDDAKGAAGRANCRRNCNSKFSGLFGAKTAPVGSYSANNFGIYDTAGNVAEWVEDCFVDNYNRQPKNGQALAVTDCDARVARGGSAKDNADRLASHARDYHYAEILDAYLGFRLAMDL